MMHRIAVLSKSISPSNPAKPLRLQADLEDKGLIVKTHTSSGRIPTSEGYKLYVDELLKIRDISQEEKAKVMQAYNKRMNQIDMIFDAVARKSVV